MNDEHELAAGVPSQRKPVSQAPKEVAKNSTSSKPSKSQFDEQYAGVPRQSPDSKAAIGEFEVQTELRKEEDVSHDPSFFASPLIFAFLVLICTAFVLVVLSEVVQFLKAVQELPFPIQIAAYVIIGLLFCLFTWAMVKLIIVYRKLALSPQVRLDQIREADGRVITRQLVASVDSGFESLQSIVRSYPIDDRKQCALLRSAGMNDEEISVIRNNIKTLLEFENAGRTQWIEDCERLFVEPIDNCAKRRVGSYAKRVAVKTALSPTGLIDSLIVATNSVLMVEDLCRIYHVRSSRTHAVFLLGRIVFSTFVSAKLEDQVTGVADSFFSGAISNLPETSKKLFAKASLGVLSRTAEGAANMALFYRLGTATILKLRPIRLK